ncbi:hypothetical protein L6164_022268 [Bauhinia variegata]|uniref:Uncharacterized protein n=1 Tax=Bauhinia variegata TaxID=167791 RepID=A0ACB9MHH8_BAUVA|nr:hypothetical protein L6164_022268 [Bauhinia variegata]
MKLRRMAIMETRSTKRRRISDILKLNEFEMGIDRISDLPDAILHHILFLLPIKYVAQMSVLSKRWRFLWTTLPDLDFTTLSPFSTSNLEKQSHPPTTTSATEDFMNQVLSVRDKHSDIGILRFHAHLSFSRLNRLIRSAIRHNVKELDVEVATNDFFNFPRCVIGSESLRVFRLKSRHPGFRLLPSSTMISGFQSLQSLSLSLVIFDKQPSLLDLFSHSSFPFLKNLHLDACFGLKYLHVGCRALEEFNLENCFKLQGLDISGAKLERLKVASCFDAYSNKSWVKINAPKLRHLLWEYNAVTDTTIFEQCSSFLHEASINFFILHEDISMSKLQSVQNFLSGLSRAHSLTLESQPVEVLSNSNFFAVNLQQFHNLKSLELRTGFNKSNFHGLACLFRSTPSLHTLILNIINDYKIERKQWNKDLWDLSSTEEEQYWESQTQNLKSFLQHLKVVKIHGFQECENEVTLAKFLLKNGKALEEMILDAGHCNARDTLRRQKIRSQLMGFSWASSNAKVVFQ